MTGTNLRTILVGLITLNLAVPVNAFHGGGHGGGGGGGGFHGGGGGGGFRGPVGGGYRGGAAPAFNRTPSFTQPHTVSAMPRGEVGNANRVNSFNEANRFNNGNRVNNVNSTNRVNAINNVNNVNRVNSVNNVNRVNNLNNVNRMGVGWNNPYGGYHQGWQHGYWNGNLGGGWGWRPYGYGGYGLGGYGFGGFGYGLGAGLGLGLGWGLSSWMFGPMLYNWGYSNYANPYYGGGYGYGGVANTAVAQPMVYDYSQPINPQSTPPDETVVSQATTVFDSAREAFKNGDYARALELVDQALKTTPNDAALHEFRAVCLFALQRYDEAAGVLYAVLSVGPGWDWTTLIGLYGDPKAYTQELRALESYCSQHPQSAADRFVLAYHYLTQGNAEAAVRQLKIVSSLQPKDQLTAQLIQQIQHTDQAASGTGVTPAQSPPAPTTPAVAASSVPAGTLEGTWTAQASPDTTITVTFVDKGHFTWKVTRQGKDQQFGGTSSYENGILTLVQDQNSNAMVGNVVWQDANHFTFKVLGGGTTDPGLSFTKSA